jgi:hypothetical protein
MHRQRTYWGIGQDMGKLEAPKALACDLELYRRK